MTKKFTKIYIVHNPKSKDWKNKHFNLESAQAEAMQRSSLRPDLVFLVSEVVQVLLDGTTFQKPN